MTGSIAIDVAIGLVFIFLLYSLFATIIQEIIANLLGLRARNLRHALTRMLEDDKEVEAHNIVTRAMVDSKQRLRRNFTKKAPGLLKEFYSHPIIKYLASGRYFSKPSYISPSDFATTILQILKEKGTAILASEELNEEIPLVDKIKAALAHVETDEINDETKKHLISLLENAQNDMQKFEANLEEWFNNTMERASGWYKKSTQLNLFIIGFILAVLFNVNTIKITKTLSKDEDARAAMVELASKYVEENQELIETVTQFEEDRKKRELATQLITQKENENKNESGSKRDTTKTDQIIVFPDTTKVDSIYKKIENYNAKLDSLLQIKNTLQDDIASANSILGFMPVGELQAKGKGIPNTLEAISKTSLKSNEALLSYQKGCPNNNLYVVSFPSNALAKKTAKYYYIEDIEGEEGKRNAKLSKWKFYKDQFDFFGYFITALAISLGASFWFDLLSKLIRIRGSIQTKNTSKRKGMPTQASTVDPKDIVG